MKPNKYLAKGRAPSTAVRVKTRRAALENFPEELVTGVAGVGTPRAGAEATELGGIFSRSCSRNFSIILATITDGTV